MPPAINWSKLQDFEKEDTTSGSKELACTAGVCEIVDIEASQKGENVRKYRTNMVAVVVTYCYHHKYNNKLNSFFQGQEATHKRTITS